MLYPIYYMLSWCCLGVCTKALAPTTPEGDWHKGRAHAAPSIYFYTCVYVCIHIYTCVHIENRSQPNQPTEPAFKPPLLRAPRVETVCLRSVMDAHTAPSSPAVMAYYRLTLRLGRACGQDSVPLATTACENTRNHSLRENIRWPSAACSNSWCCFQGWRIKTQRKCHDP